MIMANGLSYSYDDTTVFNELNLTIDDGECILIVGPSGSGKTTLSQCLSGIIPHLCNPGDRGGTVEINGKRIEAYTIKELAVTVDAVFENPETQVIGLSVEGDTAFGLENQGVPPSKIRAKVDELLNQLEISEYRESDPRHLSGGEKQRVAIASALATDPEILVLDEPVSQLDPDGKQIVLDILAREKAKGKTILVQERKLGESIQIADRVVAIDDGEIKADVDPKTFVHDESLLQNLGMWFPTHTFADKHVDTGENRSHNLKVENLWYSYQTDDKPENAEGEVPWALRDVSLEVMQGEIIGLVGHNGSGKTTLSKQFNKLLEPNHGSIWFREKELIKSKTSEVAGDIGYVFQNPDAQIFTTNVRDEVAYGPENLGYSNIEKRVDDALSKVALDDMSSERTSRLTRGQKQRLAIASVLSLEPDVLILDEPSSGLDYQTFWDLMTELVDNYVSDTRSIILISHDANIVRKWADRIVELDGGEVIRNKNTAEIDNDDYWSGRVNLPSDTLNRASKPHVGEM